ncbi:hypothetical protein AMC75_11770 [Staphylococcus carnosus]|uniref:hypothetical protein n=1 Tax=Staphylococcus carnosus TaxID=1281 RepID=UPI0006AB89FB|nr:hypothetical protein [Staphylococcus carnosus]KOR12036.1 hypothetical protein AMC75_11770 [Staphylococcus carnosus]
MKIKTKKQMNLPQLIEWGFNNPELAKSKLYLTKEHDEYSPYVQFSVDGYGVRTSQSISKTDLFTVEVEEEITEDTVIDNLYKMDEFYEFYSTEYKTIKDVIRHSVFKVKAVYLNNDLTMTLIWHDGKLVE